MVVYRNPDRWVKSWQRRFKELNEKNKLTLKQVAEWGKLRAKMIAPKDTGALIQSITSSAVTKGGIGTNRAFLSVRDIENPKNKVSTRTYGYIMHATPKQKAVRRWRSGDPHFMFTVRREVRERFKRGVMLNIRKTLSKKEL